MQGVQSFYKERGSNDGTNCIERKKQRAVEGAWTRHSDAASLEWHRMRLENALRVQNLTRNLFSLTAAAARAMKVEISHTGCVGVGTDGLSRLDRGKAC